MKKYNFIIIFHLFLVSCGYPDIDSVPNFQEINLTVDEINDYCSNIYSDKKEIDKCINHYKMKN